MPSLDNKTKTRGRPKTTGKGDLVGVRLQPSVIEKIDCWIARQPSPKPTRPEAIRRMVDSFLNVMANREYWQVEEQEGDPT
jgi:hypothetical protein